MTITNTVGTRPERIIIIGHGSPRKEANTIESLTELLHAAIHPGCNDHCVKGAYLQFSEPNIDNAFENCIREGAKRIIVHPFFLNEGMHVTKDIPEIIDAARQKHPEVEFIYTEPLGMHEKLIEVIKERIAASGGYTPAEIEKRSFVIIGDEADLSDIPADRIPVVKRVIHATADFEFGQTLAFHPDAIKTGIEAIRSGKNILTDVEMVRTGINKHLMSKWGGEVICRMPRPEEVKSADNRTRAEKGIESGLDGNHAVGIIAIGNAPTALLKVIEIFNSPVAPSPFPLVIGVPVGFVKAFESKALLASQSFPFITNLSRKGGSPVAVAIVNALLKMAEEEQ